MKKLGIHIFRRDLRVEDNTSLILASEKCERILPIFIFTPEQIEKNEYKSNNAVQFMVESLLDLCKETKIYFFYGDNIDVLKDLIKKMDIDLISFNKDYTPFSKKRDQQIINLAKESSIEILMEEDALISNIEEFEKKSFKVFTPFYNSLKDKKVRDPSKNRVKNFFNSKIESKYLIERDKLKDFFVHNPNIAVNGGRTNALKLLNKSYKSYEKSRNIPSIETTKLSPHLKFGTISVRETIKELTKESSELVRQIYWRDFWAQITYLYPKVIKNSFYDKFDKMVWKDNIKGFDAWKKGITGIPIVDAGMRELNETGFMHNRVRMLVASFLVKNLHIDWRKGAKYFANNLIDYCPMQNQNNWQSIAGTGASSLAWFRVMNPLLQQEKFDPDCEYIKKWVPELKSFSPKDIHTLNFNDKYYKQIVNLKESGKEFISIVKKL